MLGHALTMLRPIVAESGENYVDRWLSLQKNYQYVADYFMSGKDDPHREEVIDLLIRDAYLLLDEIYLQKRKKESSSMEIIELARAPHSFDTPADAFRFFWLSDLQEWDLEACLRLAGNVEMEDESLMSVSGLMLNTLRSFSSANILCMISIAQGAYEQCIKERAWVSLLLLLLQYDERMRFFPEIVGAFQDAIDTEEGRVYARTALTCLVRTLGVKWANETYKSMQEQILSQLSNANQGEGGPSEQILLEGLDDFGEDFQKECDKLRFEPPADIAKLHEQHLDMNFAMLSNLYSTAFFADPYRWFLPYAVDYLPEDMQKYSKVFRVLPLGEMCDSDKYAFISGVASVGIINGKNIDDVLSNTSDGDETPNEEYLLCNSYVQQLYRFFYLSPWNFENVFESIARLSDTQLLKLLNPTASDKQITASHCMACRAYELAAKIYSQIVDIIASSTIYRDYGFALQKCNRFEDALASYQQSVKQKPTEWLWRQMEYCCFKLERYDEALDILNLLIEAAPANVAYIYQKGKCLEHLELYAEALTQYYRAELMSSNDAKALRSIAWCNFMCDDYETSEKYYNKIHDLNRQKPIDDLNMGHLFFVQGRRMEALQAYQRCLLQQDSIRQFLDIFRPDRKYLLEKGIQKNDVYFMEDQLIQIYSTENR